MGCCWSGDRIIDDDPIVPIVMWSGMVYRCGKYWQEDFTHASSYPVVAVGEYRIVMEWNDSKIRGYFTPDGIFIAGTSSLHLTEGIHYERHQLGAFTVYTCNDRLMIMHDRRNLGHWYRPLSARYD